MKKILRTENLLPFALLVIAFLSFGVFIHTLGLYWDDFPYVFYGHVLGTSQYHHVFFDERPFLPILYNLTAPIFGENIILWQAFGILMRWACALCVGWIVRLIWTDKKEHSYIVALLFMIYPGFGQQWISTIYSRVFILLLLFLLSLAFMVSAWRNPSKRVVYTSLAIAFATLSLLGSEYFIGLEVSRLVILWLIISRESDKIKIRIKTALLHWLPYLLVVTAFAVWRGFLVQSSLYEVSAFSQNNLAGILFDLSRGMITNAYKGGILSWVQTFKMPVGFNWKDGFSLIMLPVILSSAGLTAWVFWKMNALGDEKDNLSRFWRSWSFQAGFLGVVMLLAGSIPVWAAGLPFDLKFPYNRFTLSMMFGSALVLTAVVALIRVRWMRLVILCLLVMSATGWHYQTANSFRLEWKKLTSFLQQLTWRVPRLQPGTMLTAYELPFTYYSDNSLSAPINWTYAPEYNGGSLPYILNYLTVRKNSVLKVLEPGIPITQKYRSLEFNGNTSDMVVIYQVEEGCLRVLDPVFNNQTNIPKMKDPLPKAILLSNLDRIITDPEIPALPVPQFFSQPIEASWCYYYEKADLARQVADYGEIVSLREESKSLNLTPLDITEYYPFVEGLGFTGKLDEAIELSRQMVAEKASSRKGLCQIWGRIENNGVENQSDLELIRDIKIELSCSP